MLLRRLILANYILPINRALGALKEPVIMLSLFAIIFLTVGGINLTSESSNDNGWLLVILGAVILIYKLSVPAKPKDQSKGEGGGAHHSDTNSRGGSDFSGGEGGGGD